MTSTLLSADGRAIRRLPVAVLGAAVLLAACDSEKPLSPKSPATAAIPTSAKPTVGPGNTGTLVLKIVDKYNSVIPIPFTEFKITGSAPNSWMAIDNLVQESDWTPGMLVIQNVPAGVYKVCETKPPAGLGVTSPSCFTSTVYAGATTGDSFVNLPAGTITWNIKDDLGNPRSDLTFVLDSNHVFVALVSDNDVHDIDPTVGKITIQASKEALYELCTNVVPSFYTLPNQFPCTGEVPIKMDTGTNFGTYTIVPTYPARWAVTDGKLDANNQYKLLGGARFQVYVPGGIVADAVDNGTLDYDPTVGRIAVALPFAGLTSVCETVPPPNHSFPNPVCRQLSVVANTIADFGYYINPVTLVFKPHP